MDFVHCVRFRPDRLGASLPRDFILSYTAHSPLQTSLRSLRQAACLSHPNSSSFIDFYIVFLLTGGLSHLD
ncbi:hypothetical protein M408DRAFT_205798 [Serendipita vermifera MAFF 305830]|uniref:Uncharacterized protein n=1 Tax=Serendipita vermifera MAFF 305830 TaxID=933852 RepID=A0A0C2X8Y1_SERVB|nr:hypothetical protein M408DRAFT_205798 [Serendipita vermifera MAFF 305830]